MEGNSSKAEALRAKEAAKSAIQRQDYTSANTLVRDAVKIFPGLEHAFEMLTVCDILCSSDIELPSCGKNWYWVLQLFVSVNSTDIESQYRKLIALMEPIKNDFPGTNLALELVRKAFYVLSDPVKRAAFDSQLNHVGDFTDDSNCKTQLSGHPKADNGAQSEKDFPSSSGPKRPGDEVCGRIGYSRSSMEACAEEKQKNKKVCAKEASLADNEMRSGGRTELEIVPENLAGIFSCSLPFERRSTKAEMTHRSTEERYCSDEASISNLSNPLPTKTAELDKLAHNSGMESRKPKWLPKDFIEGQVWAVYDGADAMPRLYVRVNEVISPAKVSVTFLEPHPMIDEEIHWVEENLPIVCGIFRAGRGAADLEMSMFSHNVKCDRSTKRSFYKIFPRKSEVWAVYRNWNINWKASDVSSNECRIVEIVSEFSEETGISICSLIEVPGRLTFFRRQLHQGFELIKRLARLEMLSFSHRIPAFTVLGVRDNDIPKGSWHLEPDALPPKLILVDD